MDSALSPKLFIEHSLFVRDELSFSYCHICCCKYSKTCLAVTTAMFGQNAFDFNTYSKANTIHYITIH